MMKPHSIILLLLACTVFLACKKWTDPEPPQDPKLNERKYCNDPEAMNYNWNFPGVADSSVCIYPADLFEGIYSFTDSVYDGQEIFDSARSQTTYMLEFIAIDKNRLRAIGFCGVNDSLKFTAERSTYRASADTTIFRDDTVKVFGQFFCRSLDTLSGYLTKNRNDSTLINIQLRVVSDTGIYFHKGTAIKQ